MVSLESIFGAEQSAGRITRGETRDKQRLLDMIAAAFHRDNTSGSVPGGMWRQEKAM